MLIVASLSGIQDYLFDIRESGGGQARSLRNRSFRIQLVAECVALRLLEAANLPYAQLVFSAAGKVCIDAKGISTDAARAVREAAADIERRLLSETHGRLRIAFAIENRPGSFAEKFERANRALVVNKMRPFALSFRDGVGTWGDGLLNVREVWDADGEATRDAAVGRDLVSARWLTIWRADGRVEGAQGLSTLGFPVRLEADEPRQRDDLISCSNLAEPDTAAPFIDRRCFHPRRLARHVPRDHHGDAVEFVDLAARARGASMLGVLKADADSLGIAISEALRRANGNAAASLRTLSEALDCFFAETLENEKRRSDRGHGIQPRDAYQSRNRDGADSARWHLIYTVFSGGDDLLAVGPWDIMLDFAAHVRRLFDQRFGAAARQRPCPTPLTISAGVAIIKPRYPVHLAAQQAEDLLERAKSETAPKAAQSKDQCAALGSLWKWHDHRAVITAGKQLADWVDAGVIQRGWLHTLLHLALLRRGQAGPEYAGVHPAVATSRLAYHVARNWPRTWNQPHDDRQPKQNEARKWMDNILREFDQFDATTHVATIHLPAIVRYAMLATRSGGSED